MTSSHSPARFYALHLLGVIFSLFSFSKGEAQNLVPNGGFEYFNACPFPCDIFGPMPCEPWVSLSSCNYFNVCYPGPCGVPSNFQGYQQPHSGEGYAGGYQMNSRELIQVMLLEVLTAGQCYEVSFWANLSNTSCGINHVGALFTETPVPWPIGMVPQIEGVGPFFTDTTNWFNIYGTFIATGTERYLTIGNLYTNAETQYDPECYHPGFLYSYYYWDDVVVQETETFPIAVDLGGPYEECNYVVLDPGIPNANYAWSDGSTDPTLTVTTSGTYSVVVSTSGCNGGVGSTEVIILGSPYVDLGPDVTMCEGESYTITVDPAAGNYTWNNGSHETEFIVTTPGIYSVTLDDGCDITWDEIEVTTIAQPVFTLGDDMVLCPGELIGLEFDPTLGDFLWQDNSTTSSYTIDEPGTYTLTISNECGMFSDEIEITSIDPPAFSLGPDSTIFCFGDSIELNLDPAMGDFLWQDGNTNPFYTISNTGLYSLTVTNVCGILSDQIFVNEIEPPLFDLGISIVLCPGETQILDGGEHYGNYMWQDGTTDHQYIVTTQGIYSLTVTNECGSHSDLVTVDFDPDITQPDLGPDVSLCPGEELVLEVGQSGGTIQWSDFSTANTFVVNSSGIYFVEVSTLCESFSDTIEVIVQNIPPDVNLPEDFALCEGQIVTLDPGIVNGSYQWSDGTNLPQLFISSPGIYSLTVSTACGSGVDTVVVGDGGLAPVVSLGVDTAMCSGHSIILSPTFSNVTSWNWMDGSSEPVFVAYSPGTIFIEAANDCGVAHDTIIIDLLANVPPLSLGADTSLCPGETVLFSINVPDVNILWQDGSNNNDLTIAESTTVIATISNECGSSADTVYVGFLAGSPSLDLGPDQTLCPGELVTISPGISDVTYLWHDGSAGNEYQTTQEGFVVLTITNSCGSATDTIQITESTEGPQVDLGPDLKACNGETVIIEAGISGVLYQWQDGSSSDEFVVTETGIYILTVNNACGSDTDTIEVVIDGAPPVTSLGPDTTICEGTTLMLFAGEDPLTTSTWQDGSGENEFEVSQTGIYILTQTNECGSDRDTIEVNVSGVPPVTFIGADTVLCEGASLVLSSDDDPSTTSLWQDGSTTDEFTVSVSGIYFLTESNDCGIDIDSIEVLISRVPPVVDLGSDTMLCEGTTLTLISGADPGTTLTWQDGSSLPVFLVASSGEYYLHESNGCGEHADTISISFQAMPVDFSLGPDTVLCPGETVLITGPVSTDQMKWQDGSGANSFLADQAGIYSLTLSNECGMTYDEIEVSVDDKVIWLPVENAYSICPGEHILLDASQSFEAHYVWSSGSTTPMLTVITPGIYGLTIETNCQTVKEEYTVIAADDCETDFYIPNVISPNGDNINDVFILYTSENMEILSIEGSIFDRWGGLVFMSKENPFSWDGTFGQKTVLPGVYVYRIIVRYVVDGRERSENIIGDITVLR